MFSPRCFFAQSIRCTMSWLFGSTCWANRKFCNVYSWPQYTFVSFGNFDNLPINAACISVALPSKNRPQPAKRITQTQQLSFRRQQSMAITRIVVRLAYLETMCRRWIPLGYRSTIQCNSKYDRWYGTVWTDSVSLNCLIEFRRPVWLCWWGHRCDRHRRRFVAPWHR